MGRLVVIRKNPGTRATVRANPPRARARVSSHRVLELRYRHDDDGKWYSHKFAPGVTMELLPDGSVRLFRPDGKKLWKDFR